MCTASQPPLANMNTLSDISSVSWSEESFENQSDSNKNTSTTDNQIKEKISNFSKRKKILIFTIIAILILIIISMIVTIIYLRKSNDTSNQTSTQMNSLNDLTEPISATTITTIYDVGGGGISGGPPCTSYTVINDPSRNVDQPGMGGVCDDGPLFNTNIGGRWVRFMGIGGTMLPSVSPGMQHCGAYLASWSNVTLPSTPGVFVNGSVCFQSISSICTFVLPMTVVNCGNFYVYFLPPVSFCNARYCTI